MALFKRERRDVATLEVRAPTAATQSLRWINPGKASPPDWNAHQAYDLAYYLDPITYACVRAIAETISALPFRAGPDPHDVEGYNPNAPLARMLGSEPPDGPCPGLGASELWYAAVRDYLVTGRFGWEIETTTGGDTPVALWPLTAAALTPIPSSSGTEWFSGFVYGRPSDERRLPTDRVFYVWHPSGNDYRQPESALRAASLAVSVSVMQARYDYSFLKNDARPAAIVVTEEFADEDDYAAFKQQWDTRFMGVDNAGRTAFVEAKGDATSGVKGAVDVTILGISPKDAQAAQRAEARQQETAIALGVPWSRLDASGRTFDNAAQEDEIFWRQTLLPLVTRLQNAVNVQLAPRLGPDYGWFDLSEVTVLHETPAPAVAVPAPAAVGPVPPPEPAAVEAVAAVAPEPERREPDPMPVPAPAPGVKPDRAEVRAKLWNTTQGRVVALEKAWERTMRRLFARQQRSVIARLEARRGRSAAKSGDVRVLAGEVFDPSHWLSETYDDVIALYESVMAAGGQRVSDLFGIAFDLEAPWVQQYIQQRANQLAGQVNQTTYQAIQDALGAGTKEGEAIPELAARVKGVFAQASDYRATTIARTEVISAFNGSATETAKQYGSDVVGGQEWIATQDARTRDSHADTEGPEWTIGLDEVFPNGLAYPGDPAGEPAETINCRCTIGFLTPEEMDEQGRSRMMEVRTAYRVLELVEAVVA